MNSMSPDFNTNQSLIKPEPPRAFRWIVLVLISLAMFGNYYVYDAISPMADLLAHSTWVFRFKYRAAASHLQYSKYFYGAHWRIYY